MILPFSTSTRLAPLALAVAMVCATGHAQTPAASQEVSITIKALAAQMKYNVPEFTVPPGAKVKLTLVNEDEMPHNLVVTTPANDKGMALAQKAWALGGQGMAKHWVPDDPRVLAATKTVQPHAKEEIIFTAPKETGSYPFVCTFPGHSMIMNGAMRVVSEGSKVVDGRFQLFLGKWDKLPDFSTLKPLREGALEGDTLAWKFDDYKNEFGIRFTGKLTVKTEGEHIFRVASDDGARLSINGKTVITNDGIHPASDLKDGKIKLKPGTHDLQLDYFQAAGGAELYVSWQGPDFSETWLTKSAHPSSGKPGKKKDDSKTGMPIVVKDEPVIYRNFIAGVASARAIAVGYPGGVNAAYDADQCNVALVWRGAFMDAKRHWTDRGVGFQPPLGYGVVAPATGVPLAVLERPDASWPPAPKSLQNGDWPEGYRFQGYTLDAQGYPTFRYTYGQVAVEDRLAGEKPAPSTHGGHAGAIGTLKRALVLKSAAPVNGLHFRVAAGGKLAERNDGLYLLDEGVLLSAPGATLRKGAEGSELLVPITFKDGTARVEVTYHWNH